MTIREKLLQAHELEKEYQDKHRLGQKNAQVEFVNGLKQLGIKSIPEYHELFYKMIKEQGLKGRTIEIKRVIDETLLDAVQDAMDNKKDTLLWAVTTKDIVYVGSVDKIDSRVDEEFCRNARIPFVPHKIIRPGEIQNAFLSVAGNCSLLLVITKPVNPNAICEIIQKTLIDIIKENYDVDIKLIGVDGMVENKKVMGANSIEYQEVCLIAVGFSIKNNEELIKKVFPVERRHPSGRTPSSLEFILGKQIDEQEFFSLFIPKFRELCDGN